jgi:hypothetical protein
MCKIRMPGIYESRVQNTSVEGPLQSSIGRFAELVGDGTRGLALFPEYPDHGIDHYQHVIDASEGLITNEFRDSITPEDVAVMMLSILLHDSAMHLTADGFLTLLIADDFCNVVPQIDKSIWADLWEDYLFEVSRWDGRKIGSFLGVSDSNTIQKCIELQVWRYIHKGYVGSGVPQNNRRVHSTASRAYGARVCVGWISGTCGRQADPADMRP